MSLIISEIELNEKLASTEIIYKRFGRGSDGSARPRGATFPSGIPSFVREIIAGEARAGIASKRDIADSWDISPTAVGYAEDARIGRHQKRGEEVALDIAAGQNASLIENRIIDAANKKLLTSIEAIKDDAVVAERPIVQSSIARNLASIVERLKPRESNGNTNIAFIVHQVTEKPIEIFGEPIRVNEIPIKR
jgi:hypothetical protein